MKEIVINTEDLKRVRCQIMIDPDMYKSIDIDYIIKREIFEGLVNELMKSNLIDIKSEEVAELNCTKYTCETLIYKKENSEK